MRGARLRYLLGAVRGTASQQANNFRELLWCWKSPQEQGLLRVPLATVTPKRRGEPKNGGTSVAKSDANHDASQLPRLYPRPEFVKVWMSMQ